MKKLIIVKPKTLSPADKGKLTKAGYLVIEHPDPNLGIVVKEVEECAQRYVYTNCNKCGERVYLLEERLAALKTGKATFYCSDGHGMNYK